MPELKTETTSDSGRKSEPTQAVQGQAEELGNISEQTKKLAKVSNDWAGKLAIAKRQLELIEEKLASGKLKESQIVAYQSKRISLLDKIDKINQQITKEKEEQEKTDEDGGKKEEKKANSLSKLLKSFGRIAMYRAVRRTIQEITQAFMESIDGIARYNDEFRSTMGNLQSSMAKAKASIGVAFYQVLILIEPLITQLANGVANLANSLAKVTANMRGVANYTKINTEYMKKYKSATQGTLLAFDTFTTLSSNQQYDPSDMFKSASDALDVSQLSEGEKTLKTLMQTLGELLQIIKDLYKAIEPLLTKIINDLLPPVMDLLNQIVKIVDLLLDIFEDALKEAIDFIGTVVKQISGAVQSISGILKLLTGDFDGAWKDIANGFANMVNGIVNMFISLAKFIKDVINIVIKPVGKVFGQDWEIKKDIEWRMNWQPYANGGMMTRNTFFGAGTMYALAGESGAEVVATGSAGTGVLNVDQFADAMVSALVRYGAARDTSNGTTIVLDGNKVGQLVASNVGFRNEANRRNAGLNWK